jgi:hypothetical protein
MYQAHRLYLRALLLCGGILLVLASTLALTAYPGSFGAAHAVHRQAPAAASARAQPAPRSALDPLRVDALAGNTDASAELAQRLLTRFERTGEQEDLYEAFQWIARDWDDVAFLRSDLIQRAVEHCDGPVLQWHWLCVDGE